MKKFNLDKTAVIIIVAVAIVFGAGGFYAGMIYGKSSSSGGLSQAGFQNLSLQERQQRLQQMGVSGGRAAGTAGRTGGGFVNGEVISKDDKSITVKLGNGGSQIIFYSGTTEFGKFMTGSSRDVEVGSSVTISGTSNSDGSITARSIQLRPTFPIPGGNVN